MQSSFYSKLGLWSQSSNSGAVTYLNLHVVLGNLLNFLLLDSLSLKMDNNSNSQSFYKNCGDSSLSLAPGRVPNIQMDLVLI